MTFIRSLLFNIYFPIWTFSLAAISLPFLLFPPKFNIIIGRIWSKGTTLGLWAICGINYEVRGKENLPEDPFIIASKHQSAWETVIYLSLIKCPAYVLKKELLNLPLFGWHLRGMKMIAVDRDGGTKSLKKMLSEVKQRIAQKRSIVIFPEGTRTAPGEKTTYHPGVAFIYKDPEIDAPVIPVALNSGLFWRRNAFTKMPGKIILEYLPPIEKGLGRKEFAKKLQDAIESKSDELIHRH